MPKQQQLANAIRALSMDAVQEANSGHPGMPMGMADIAEVLWNQYLVHNPNNPQWWNRDRFVLSNGHGSMLLYSLLHLSGYDLSVEDLKRFRQLHSKTPGHPEYGDTPGVETTTGPLGQGLANAVGMAIAECVLAETFNQKSLPIIDHYTYAFIGDGCLMEGISHEACSLAGSLGLGKLIVFYDDNNISIDGNTDGWFCDDTARRFGAYHWQVIEKVDGHNPQKIKQAIDEARREKNKPTLICCKTIIGYGAPNKQGTAGVHGAPLGDEEIALARKSLNWQYAPFEVPDDIYSEWNARHKGEQSEKAWQEMWDKYCVEYPQDAAELKRRINGELPKDWMQWCNELMTRFMRDAKDIATRKSSLLVLQELSEKLPELIGGSADLGESNCVIRKNMQCLTSTKRNADYIYYGVREFAMSAISNGIALYGGFIPYVATFLVFSDYARNAIRMASLMKQRHIFVFTHDSIGLGEDGPTHQPVEHLTALRAIPNLNVWRPCDTVESAVAWQSAIESTATPSALIFSRQNLTQIDREQEQVNNVFRGGYILRSSGKKAQLTIIATGSEVEIAFKVWQHFVDQGYALNLVSMPCCEVFNRQSPEYQEKVIPSDVPSVAIEAGCGDYWHRYVGRQGIVIAIDGFGASAKAQDLFDHYGFNEKAICEKIAVKLK